MIILSGLTYYPIKSCRGIDVESSEVDAMGLAHDRRMMVVTPSGDFLTQRELPRLALVTPVLHDDSLTLSAPGFDPETLTLRTSGDTVPVRIWKTAGVLAVDQGDPAAEWFSSWLSRAVRLVHLAPGAVRRLDPRYAHSPGDHTAFTDGYPILLASEASLEDLNARLSVPLPMNRFRPNVVVSGLEPFAEDAWKRIRIGALELAIVKPCARCVVTTIDKETLETSREPLRTLSRFRRQPGGVMFGQNAVPLGKDQLHLGAAVEVLEQ